MKPTAGFEQAYRLKLQEEECGIFGFRPRWAQRLARIELFAALMCLVIGVQGLYLGYIVGVLTTLERSFQISSKQSGAILTAYDVGHTLTVLFVGYLGASRHKPRWTAIGCLISSLSMFGLCLPHFIFGARLSDVEMVKLHNAHIGAIKCKPDTQGDQGTQGSCPTETHHGAYAILIVSQLLAGIAAAPFNTLSYIYIDDNVSVRKSPFYLGLLTSMYAFGPAFGFGLSAFTTTLHVDLRNATDIDQSSPSWIGAWWLGFVFCCVLYLFCALPLFLFPYRLPNIRRLGPNDRVSAHEMHDLHGLDDHRQVHEHVACATVWYFLKELPRALWLLLKNSIYSSMLIAWVFSSYLVGGYGTYLPKYFETQYSQTPSMADVYSGLITIGAVAVSTAIGGYLLTKFNIQPRMAMLCLIISWSVITVTFLVGLALGCPEPNLLPRDSAQGPQCSSSCYCDTVTQFEPICVNNNTYFSPCHAGCRHFDGNKWTECDCAEGRGSRNAEVYGGFCESGCNKMPIYLSVMFVGLFAGNIFFMTTMMVILRCVEDEMKSLALSFASAITNIFGFIPGPIIFGSIIDTSCAVWKNQCGGAGGNCILYSNEDFRNKFHLGNAAFQLIAIGAVIFTYAKSATYPFSVDSLDDVEPAIEASNFRATHGPKTVDQAQKPTTTLKSTIQSSV